MYLCLYCIRKHTNAHMSMHIYIYRVYVIYDIWYIYMVYIYGIYIICMHNMYPFGAYATGMNPFAQAQRELRHLLHPATSKRRRSTSDGQWAPKRAGFGDEKWCFLWRFQVKNGRKMGGKPKNATFWHDLNIFKMILKVDFGRVEQKGHWVQMMLDVFFWVALVTEPPQLNHTDQKHKTLPDNKNVEEPVHNQIENLGT